MSPSRPSPRHGALAARPGAPSASSTPAAAGGAPRAAARSSSVAPLSQPIAQSLAGDDGLARLLARVRASEARLADVAEAVPPPLRACLRAGPLDDEGWTLLAANAAVAAKLRHLLPVLAQVLMDKGWEATSIRVRVQPKSDPR